MTDEITSPSKRSLRLEASAPKIVSLVGFMGAGKTTVGRALAARLGWRFEDLDDLIQAREGRTIQQIFLQSGEQYFRKLEREALEEAVSSHADALVLSLGGGAFIDNTNRQLLRDNKISAVFLDAPVEELFRRCGEPGVVRPLLRDRDQFCGLYEQRRPAYVSAEFCIQTTGREIDSIVDEIISSLSLTGNSGASK